MWRWPSLRSPSPPPPWRGSSAAARLPGTGGWRATMRLGRLKSPVAFCRLLVVAVDEGEHAPLHSLSGLTRSEEHTSELQSLMRISYAVFCLKKKTDYDHSTTRNQHN